MSQMLFGNIITIIAKIDLGNFKYEKLLKNPLVIRKVIKPKKKYRK